MHIDKKTIRNIFLGAAACIVLYWLLNEWDRVSLVWNFLSDILAPFVIGAALALDNNATSAPVKGNAGVYMVRIGEKVVAEGELDAAQEIATLNMRSSYAVPYQAMALIEEHAEVEDNRARFQ